jgi:hypothetical protein
MTGGAQAPYVNNQEFLIGYMIFDSYQFGWMRAKFDAQANQIIILEYAYDASGAEILAGDRGAVGINDVSEMISVALAPNPASDAVTITYENSNNEPLSVGVYDMSGRAVMNARLTGSVGANQEVLDVSALSRGQYILRFETGEFVKQESLILTR